MIDCNTLDIVLSYVVTPHNHGSVRNQVAELLIIKQ